MGDSENRPDYRSRQHTRARLKAIGAPCAICHRPIDYDLDWWVDQVDGKRQRHPLSFEYDHRYPNALGGGNGFDNAQPAHRICNQRKGAKVRPDAPQSVGEASEGNTLGDGGGLPVSRAW